MCPWVNLVTAFFFFYFTMIHKVCDKSDSPQNASGSNDLADSSLYAPGIARACPPESPGADDGYSILTNIRAHTNKETARPTKVSLTLLNTGFTCR